jgi:hypothetical protein
MNVDWAAATPWIVGVSIFMFVASLVVLPLLLIAMPADYFTHRGPRFGWLSGRHPVVRITILAAKNVLGSLLLVAGVVMLVTPGQGILAILIGVCLLDFPGKRNLERSILRRRGILSTLNAIRAKAGKPPLQPPDGVDDHTKDDMPEQRGSSQRG